MSAEAPDVTSATDNDTLDVVVIGAGFAGIYAVHKFRELGFRARGIEAGTDVGGTWYWNRYPGAQCDSESMYYSFSFLTDFEQEWPLDERFPGQPKVLKYLEAVADRLDIRKEFAFSNRVNNVTLDESTSLWTVRTDTGLAFRTRFVVSATGPLSMANTPVFQGAESFQGEVYHTGRWPKEPVDFTGKRVGIIGTGASGIQSIPIIAETAAQLTVFQRTPQFTLPAQNGPIDPQFAAMWKANYPEWRRRGRNLSGCVPYTAPDRSALEVTPEEREQIFQWGWDQGGFSFRLTFKDLMTDPAANATAADFVRAKIDELVDDPEVAELLKPRSYYIGTKRLPADKDYYATFNRPNVKLVSVLKTPIEEIDETGIRTSAEHFDLDMLIYATGFDAVTGAILALDVEGRNGLKLRDKWADGYQAYLGLMVPGFPNLFTIVGPGSPAVNSNVPTSIEQHVDWIADCLEYLRAHDVDFIEAEEEPTTKWIAHVQEVANLTLYPTADSWYMGANVAGKPRVYMAYLGGTANYRNKCDEIAANGYEGFTLGTKQASAV